MNGMVSSAGLYIEEWCVVYHISEQNSRRDRLIILDGPKGKR